jgi:hypothetical protein
MQLTPEQFQEFLDPIVGMIETECRRKGLPLSSLDSESVYFAIEDAMRRSHKWTIDQPV